MSDLLNNEKRIYELFWNLLRDRQLMTVFERFGPQAFRRSSVLEGFETFIKAHGFCGGTVVEIGTLKGLTAVVLSRYFERVITIDIADDPQKYEIVEALGITNIGFINVKDNAEKAIAINGREFDAAYMDGDHTNDSATDFALVKRCGRVLCHEFWNAQPSVEETLRASGGRIQAQGKLALWTAT